MSWSTVRSGTRPARRTWSARTRSRSRARRSAGTGTPCVAHEQALLDPAARRAGRRCPGVRRAVAASATTDRVGVVSFTVDGRDPGLLAAACRPSTASACGTGRSARTSRPGACSTRPAPADRGAAREPRPRPAPPSTSTACSPRCARWSRDGPAAELRAGRRPLGAGRRPAPAAAVPVRRLSPRPTVDNGRVSDETSTDTGAKAGSETESEPARGSTARRHGHGAAARRTAAAAPPRLAGRDRGAGRAGRRHRHEELALSALEGEPPVRVLGGLFYLQLVRNPGAAFGMATGMTWLLTLIALAVVVAHHLDHAASCARSAGPSGSALVLAGALGNLDRPVLPRARPAARPRRRLPVAVRAQRRRVPGVQRRRLVDRLRRRADRADGAARPRLRRHVRPRDKKTSDRTHAARPRRARRHARGRRARQAARPVPHRGRRARRVRRRAARRPARRQVRPAHRGRAGSRSRCRSPNARRSPAPAEPGAGHDDHPRGRRHHRRRQARRRRRAPEPRLDRPDGRRRARRGRRAGVDVRRGRAAGRRAPARRRHHRA